MIDVHLARIVIHEGLDRQYIFLAEEGNGRGFPIVIGNNEAWEIQRMVTGMQTVRPLTHQLCHEAVRALGGEIKRVDIVDLRDNTFFAQMVLETEDGSAVPVDARPSDAIALALRANCRIRVAESVLERAASEEEPE